MPVPCLAKRQRVYLFGAAPAPKPRLEQLLFYAKPSAYFECLHESAKSLHYANLKRPTKCFGPPAPRETKQNDKASGIIMTFMPSVGAEERISLLPFVSAIISFASSLALTDTD